MNPQSNQNLPEEARRPLVSVIIPSYNHAAFVGEAIVSAAQQRGVDVEIIVVDDGSSDGSPRVVEGVLGDLGVPSELIVQENRGAHAAINRGLAAARGEFLQILNSDDRLDPGRCSRMISLMEHRSARIAFSDLRLIDARGEVVPALHPKVLWYVRARRILLSEPSAGFALLRINAAVSSSNFLMRRGLWEDAGDFTAERLCHDWTFLMRVLPLAEPLHVAEPLLDYRIHESNTVDRVRALRRAEGEPALRAYLAAVATAVPANDRAPCAHWWPGFFPVFARTRHPWFADEPIAGFLPAQAERRLLPEPVAADGGPAHEGAGDAVARAEVVSRDRSIRALINEVAARDRAIADLRARLTEAARHRRGATLPLVWRVRRRLAMLALPTVRRKPPAVIFGAGGGGQRAFALLKSGWTIEAFLDSDPAKQGTRVCDRPVLSPDRIDPMGETVVFVASMYSREIHARLRANGVAGYRIQHVEPAILRGLEAQAPETYRVMLVGAGECARGTREFLAGDCEVVAVGSPEPHALGEEIARLPEFPENDPAGRSFDCVVVADAQPDRIIAELEALGLSPERVVVVHPARQWGSRGHRGPFSQAGLQPGPGRRPSSA